MSRLHFLGIYVLVLVLLASLALPVSYPLSGWQGFLPGSGPGVVQQRQGPESFPQARVFALEASPARAADRAAVMPGASRRIPVAASVRHTTAQYALMRLYALARLHLHDNAPRAN